MKNDKRTKNELIKELESVRRKVKKLETLLEKRKHTQHDITERLSAEQAGKQAETALKQVETYLRTVLSNAPITIFAIDNQGLFTLSEGKGLERVGLKPGENVGMSALDLFGTTSFKEYNGRVTTGKEIIQRVFAGETVNAIDELHGIYFDNHIGPIYDAEGKVAGIVGVATDITERKQAEEKLRQSEQKWRSLVSNSPDFIALHDREGRYLFLNHYAEGFTEKDINGKKAYDFISKESRGIYRAAFEECIRTMTKQNVKYSALGDNAETRMYESSFVPIMVQGNEINVLDVARDITERRLAEEKLRESEARYKSLFENSIIGISQALPDGRLICANTAYAQMYGYKNTEEIMAAVAHVGMQLYANSEDREEVLHILKEKGVMESREMAVKRRDGSRFFVLVGAREIRDPKGNLLYYQAEHVDITERKRAEEELQSEQKMLTRTESIAHVGSWEWDIATDTVIWSDELFRIFQRDPREGAPSFAEHPAFYHPDDMARLQKAVEAAVADGTPYALELRAIRKDGETRVCVARGVTEMSPGGRAVRLFGSLQDITERKRAEEALKISETLFRELFNNMKSGSAIFKVINDGSKGSDYIIKKMNLAGLKMEGKALEEVIGKRLIDIRPTIDSYGLIPVMKKVWETGEPAMLPIKIYIDERYSNYYENYVFKLPSGEVVTLYDDVTVGKMAEEQIQILSRFPTENPNPVLRIAPEGVILYANDASKPLLAMWNTQIGQVVPDDWRMQIAEMSKSDHRKEIEVRCIQQVFSCILAPIVSAGYVNVYCRDITDRKRTEEALRESEMRYRELFDNISSGVAIYEVKDNGEDFVFQDFNKAGERIDGDRKEDLIGRSIFQVRPGIKEFGLLDVFKRVWKTGKPEYFPAKIYQDKRITNWYENFIYRLPTGEIVTVFDEITERKKVEEELSKSHEELRMLANHLQNIREEERNHLAREFHDQLGQSMTALKMDLSLLLRMISDEKQDVQRKLIAEELQSMQKLVDETSQLLWTIITELRPQMLDDLGLVATFEWEAQQFESRTGISCEFKSSAGDIQMDSKKSIALFRIYQEALTNITRHANATVVKSVLRRDKEVLVLEIKDNGCGITLNEKLKPNSFGLIGMRERVLALGGQLEISGIAGEGTTIIVQLPL